MGAIGRFIPRRRARLLAKTLAIAFVCAAAAFAGLSNTRFGHELEYKSIDLRFQARGPIEAPDDVVILGIDNDTDQALQAVFPYSRAVHADAIDRLTDAGAEAIVFDIQFLDRMDAARGGAAGDIALLDAARRSGRVVFATAPESKRRAGDEGSTSGTITETPMPFRGVTLPGGLDPLAWSGAVVANATQGSYSDGVRRWVTPLQEVVVAGHDAGSGVSDRRTLPALSLAAIAVAEHKSPFEYKGLPERMNVNYVGPGGSQRGAAGFEYHNYSEVVDDGATAADLSFVRGKIVLIGATSTVLQDLHETPFPSSFVATDSRRADGAPGGDATTEIPGVEIHANAINTIREGNWLIEQPPGRQRVAVFAMAIFIWALLTMTPLFLGIPLALALPVGYAWYAQQLFERGNEVVALVPPLGSAAATFLGVVLYIAVQAYRERKRVTGLFARYVSPDVVRDLVDISEELVVGGQRREISVLFSDIRGFTTLSEHLDPAELVSQLNEYFEEMIEAIELERGTFDKFIGDGLMAIFGAPLDMPDHADRACAVALDMAERLDELNESRADRGLAQLAIGIGIHSGEAIVGNIGSPARRVDFTAIGDTVNLASRLESSTKTVGARILVSRETAEMASSHVFAPRGEIVVKGRTQATEVFELLSDEVGVHERDAETAATGADQPRLVVAPPEQAA